MKSSTPIILLVALVLMFLLSSFLIMITYNNSIPRMNPNWKKMDYRTALIFTIFVSLISGRCGSIKYEFNKI
jgi:hypothetical protein